MKPSAVRKDQIKPWGGPRDSGVSGDPTKATAEIGRMGIEFKINAAIAQMLTLKKTGIVDIGSEVPEFRGSGVLHPVPEFLVQEPWNL